MKVGIILTTDNRSKAYIQKLIKNNIILDDIILMNSGNYEKKYSKEIIKKSIESGFDISIPVVKTLKKNNLNFHEFDFVDINNSKLIEYVKNSKIKYYLFTGGGILKKAILNAGPKFIHFHPGIVPNYRGSTCFYYSIINENNCGVTSFVMDEKLDTGDIIYQKKFLKPNHIYIDEIFDPFIRSETMIDVIQKNLIKKSKFLKQNMLQGETYFIIHPVLKHISIMNCVK
jgi:methionyl-tRNA formyltransferase